MTYLQVLGNQEVRQHIDQTHALWGGGAMTNNRFEKLKRRLEAASPRTFFMSGLVDAEGNLTASLKRYYFPLQVRGERLNCVGLGAIFTESAHRKKGLAAQLIEMVLAESKTEYGCAASVLYSDIDVRYYEKFGFVKAPASTWSIDVSKMPNTASFSTRPVRMSEVPLLTEWHRESVCRFPLYSERTEETWKLFREINHVERDLVLMDAGKDIGFLSLSSNREQNYLWVEEWCAPHGAEPTVWATVRKIAQTEGYSQVKGWNLPSYRLDGTESAPRTRAVPMVAMLNGKFQLSPAEMISSYFASPDHF